MNTLTGFKTFICAGTVVLVADELSAAEQQDGLDALLYAQTVACHKHPDVAQVEPWNHASKIALRMTGALLLENPEASLPVPMPDNFTLAEVTERILHPWVPASTSEVVRTCLGPVSRQASSDRAMAVLQQHALLEGRWIRFGFGFLSQDLKLSKVVIAFEFDEVVNDSLLCHRFNTENVRGNVSIDCFQALIDPEDYAFSRDKVIALLGARRQEQIIALT